MRKTIFLMLLFCTSATYAQEFGLSFSYFLPRNGNFSTPISPFSIRGIGVNLNKFTSLETGASLYRMAGLNIVNLPFESKDPILAPNFTLLVPVELVFTLQGSRASFDVKGGVFGFVPFANRIDYGNLDKAIRTFEGWNVANATVTDYKKSSVGYGWLVGAELTIPVASQFSLSLETNCLAGAAAFPMSGSYQGGNTTLDPAKAFNYKDASIDLTGLEISIGVSMSTSGGRPRPKKRR
jgi:hypothetical protein